MGKANKHKKPSPVRIPSVPQDVRERINQIIADITAERQSASNQISIQSRTVALGVLALAWLLLAGAENSLLARFKEYSDSLLIIAAVCVGSLLADFVQYLVKLWETNGALTDSYAATAVDEAGYDDPSWLRRTSNSFFVIKLASSLGAAVAIFVVIYRVLKGV